MPLTKDQGKLLLQLARHTISHRLNPANATLPQRLTKALASPPFTSRRGVFVTLTTAGKLRGCIGAITATDTIADGIRTHAINAAFNDHRFQPLQEKELAAIKIEISILTEATPLKFNNPEELLTILKPQVDGVILQVDRARATFLPQVWQQLPGPEDFLANLALKAGLNAQGWRDPRSIILTYQVQHFEE